MAIIKNHHSYLHISRKLQDKGMKTKLTIKSGSVQVKFLILSKIQLQHFRGLENCWEELYLQKQLKNVVQIYPSLGKI